MIMNLFSYVTKFKLTLEKKINTIFKISENKDI